MALKMLERGQKRKAQVIREDDQRYFPRWKVNKPVESSEEGWAAFRSYTKDLSLDGAAILVLGNPPERHRIQLRIHLADKENFEAQGRIAWRKVEPTHQLFGIVFEKLSKKAQKLILRNAFDLSEEDLILDGLIKRCVSSPNVPLCPPQDPGLSAPQRPAYARALRATPLVATSARMGWPNAGSLLKYGKQAGRRWLWKGKVGKKKGYRFFDKIKKVYTER